MAANNIAERGCGVANENIERARRISQEEGVPLNIVLQSDILDEIRGLKEIIQRREGWFRRFWAATSAAAGEFFAMMRNKE
jgi:hypothetical protein